MALFLNIFLGFIQNKYKVMNLKKVLFISSTGGHLRELMKLEPLFKDYDYSIITEKEQ